jgi:hypothetical protein
LGIGDGTLSHLKIVYSGPNFGLASLGGTISHVVVIATEGIACGPIGLISDAVCVTTASIGGAAAVEVAVGSGGSTRGTSGTTLRNVTAIGTQPSSLGVFVSVGDSETVKLTMINSIAKGGMADAATDVDDNTATRPGDLPPIAKLVATHSDLRTKIAYSGNGTVNPSGSITTDHTDVTAAPKFVNPATFNFRELAGSPTINSGAKDKAGTDLAGSPRTLGQAPDLGAFEFRQKPAVHGLKVTSTGGAQLSGKVKINGEGLLTKADLVVTRSGHQVKRLTLRRVRHARSLRFTVRGLLPGRRYHLQVVAKNPAGTARTAKLAARTNG